MDSLADRFKEERMSLCTCGHNTRAVLYCNRGCNPNSFYYCFDCDSKHDHKIILVAKATSDNSNDCLVMRQEMNEFYDQIQKSKTPYEEFLGVMKDVAKLTNFDEKAPENPLIHEDFEDIEKLKTEFDETFEKS